MTELSEREPQRQRAAKNQSVFREVNERNEDLAQSASFSAFICECMTESCDESVSMTLEEYEHVRAAGNSFLVLPGHDVPEVEDIIEAGDRYLTVSKLGSGARIAEALDPRKRRPPAAGSSLRSETMSRYKLRLADGGDDAGTFREHSIRVERRRHAERR
jgi:hypothetical protein